MWHHESSLKLGEKLCRPHLTQLNQFGKNQKNINEGLTNNANVRNSQYETLCFTAFALAIASIQHNCISAYFGIYEF